MIYLFTCNQKGLFVLIGHYYYYESKIICLYENFWYLYKKDSCDFIPIDNIITIAHDRNDVEVYSYEELDVLLDKHITKIIFDKL